MIQIRPEQMALFAEQAWERFVDGLVPKIEEAWPAACAKLGTGRTRGVVEAAGRQAKDRGFKTEYDVGRYIHLAFAFESLRFAEQPWAQPLMANPDLPPRVRMNQLFAAALARLDGGAAQ